jgi:hypothetical protein
MKRTSFITIAAVALLALFNLGGCGFLDDLGDEIETLVTGEDQDDETHDWSHKRPYSYMPARAALGLGAVLDPYDGSLVMLDPTTRKRIAMPLTADPVDFKSIENGSAYAILDDLADELRIVDTADRDIVHVIDVGETVNKLVISPYGTYLLAIYDPNRGDVEFGDSGMVNYFELDIIHIPSGNKISVSIDFTPENIVFTPDGLRCLLGRDYRLVLLDLDTADTVSYPLSLGPEDPKVPKAIAVSPDSEFAMVLVKDTADVYVLDLVNPSINILDLTSAARDILFIPNTRVALLPVPADESIALVDLDEAVPEQIEIGRTLEKALLSPDSTLAVFYEDGGDELVVMTLDDQRTRVYPLNVRINSDRSDPISFTPDSSKIVVQGQPGYGSYGQYDIDVVDLVARVVVPLGFEGAIGDMVYSEQQQTLAVLLPAAFKLSRVDLNTLEAEAFDLDPVAKRVSYVPEAGAFLVDYDDDAGRVTFVGDQGSEILWTARGLFDPPGND